MKKILLATAAALTLLAAPSFAGNVNGCETVPVEGSNYSVRVDVTCPLSNDKPDGPSMFYGLDLSALRAPAPAPVPVADE
jgi:hypothetical protein